MSSSDHESPSATTSAGLFIPSATDDHDHESPSVTTAAGLFLPLATDDHEHESSSATKGGGLLLPLATTAHVHEEVGGWLNVKFSPIRSSLVDYTRRSLATKASSSDRITNLSPPAALPTAICNIIHQQHSIIHNNIIQYYIFHSNNPTAANFEMHYR